MLAPGMFWGAGPEQHRVHSVHLGLKIFGVDLTFLSAKLPHFFSRIAS